MHDPRISALLRLKRHEQPPAGYFDQLLREVHQRQRTELLRRPLWKIAAERVQVFFSEHSMGSLSYAGAMATVLVVGVTAIKVMTPVEVPDSRTADLQPTPKTAPAGSGNRMLVLGPQSGSEVSPLVSPPRENVVPVGGAPRYVIDARPVSYEPAFNF
jgi:hypothetical protein